MLLHNWQVAGDVPHLVDLVVMSLFYGAGVQAFYGDSADTTLAGGGFGALMTAPWLFSADTVVGGCERPGSLLNLVSQFSLSVVSDSL